MKSPLMLYSTMQHCGSDLVVTEGAGRSTSV